MMKLPRFVKVGSALGFAGGFISVACLAIFFAVSDNTLIAMGAYLLIAVMFFGLAGGLTKGGQWTWNVLLLMTFLTLGVVGGAVVFAAVDLYAGIVLGVVGALIIISLAMPSSRIWANRMRV
ncbi:MAG: hypothetical protein FWF07_02250 [Methanomassiliicoccaceae archaeon]|nr:hypothetical protein [Methanomassiliicoccaceae archaeon]